MLTGIRVGVSMGTLFNRVISVIEMITDIRPARGFRDSDDLYVDLEFDSLDATEFVIGLETEFDIKISDEESENLRTISDVVHFVDHQLKALAT